MALSFLVDSGRITPTRVIHSELFDLTAGFIYSRVVARGGIHYLLNTVGARTVKKHYVGMDR